MTTDSPMAQIQWLIEPLQSHVAMILWPIVVLLMVYAFIRLSAHTVLLYGQVERLNSGHYQYLLFVQNVEDVGFDGVLWLVLKTDTVNEALRLEKVSVYAGPRRIEAHEMHEKPTQFANGSSKVMLKFTDLPPFDTWRVDVSCKAQSLTLEILTHEPTPWYRPSLRPSIRPTSLSVKATETYRASAGSSSTGDNRVSFVLIIASIVIYALVVLGRGPRLTEDALGYFVEIAIPVFLAGVIYLAHRLFRRPVYPIIQGYREKSNLSPRTQDKELANKTSL